MFYVRESIIHADINGIGIGSRCNSSAVATASDAAVQRVVVDTVSCRYAGQRCVISNLLAKATVAVEAVGHALCAVAGASQIASRSAGYADRRRGRNGIGVTGYLHAVTVGGALNAKRVSALPAARQLGREIGKGSRAIAKIQRTEGNTVLAGRAVNQTAVGQRQGCANGAIAACQTRNG